MAPGSIKKRGEIKEESKMHEYHAIPHETEKKPPPKIQTYYVHPTAALHSGKAPLVM